MDVKNTVKKIVPVGLKRLARRVYPKRQSTAPFKQPDKDAIAARERYRQITWPTASPSRVVYAITPTASLKNVGDQAQVVAIERWIAKHYPGRPIVELDKDICLACMDDIKEKVGPDDLVFLHSGGNMGDRGRWSEASRRTVIQGLLNNRMVSLPQTIHFRDTELGNIEKQRSIEIYKTHPRLTIIGRDKESGLLSDQLFPRAQRAVFPDFVLSLDINEFQLSVDPAVSNKLLACLRMDNESIFEPKERLALSKKLGEPATLFDTTLDTEIAAKDRVRVLTETLSLFMSHNAVVTDRFHGLIFSVLCKKPTVVLRTVDHKLTSAVNWFSDIPNVRLVKNTDEIPQALAAVRAIDVKQYPDFNKLYFDKIPDLIAELP